MAACRVSKNQIVCLSKDIIIVYNVGESNKQIYRSERPRAPKPEEKKQPQGNEEGQDLILCSGFSPKGQFFVSCDDYKQLSTWRVTDSGTWDKLSTRSLVRRATSLTFTQDEPAVLVGDKSGDVYSFSTSSFEENGELLLGHVSMLLDLTLCDDDRFLVTCDRDEKIRISHHPNGYSIHSFCLGHTEFVSCLAYCQEEDVLLSGSGDGSVRLWNYQTGEQLDITDCSKHVQQELAVLKPESTTAEEEMEVDNEAEENTKCDEVDLDWKKARLNALKDQQPLDLKCLRYCQKNKTIALGFDRLSVVLLYMLHSEDRGVVPDLTLTFVDKLQLDGPLWDLTYDEDGHLYVLQADSCSPLQVYTTAGTDTQVHLAPLTADTDPRNVLSTVNAINQEWDLLKGSLQQDSIFSVLHKVKMDNLSIYQQQKETKMQEQVRKYKEKQERRKRGKQVLPSGESEVTEETDSGQVVAPPSECGSSQTARNNEQTFKKQKVTS